MKQTYSKSDKLKSQKIIEQLFENGQYISAFPLRLIYLETNLEGSKKLKTAVSVSKRNFKNAVDRNRIKRLLREAYRLQKSAYFNNITTQYAFMILYIGKEMPSYADVEKNMRALFEKFSKTIAS
jgi:ribonuclease P protein component